jgi:hypothetical protein
MFDWAVARPRSDAKRSASSRTTVRSNTFGNMATGPTGRKRAGRANSAAPREANPRGRSPPSFSSQPEAASKRTKNVSRVPEHGYLPPSPGFYPATPSLYPPDSSSTRQKGAPPFTSRSAGTAKDPSHPARVFCLPDCQQNSGRTAGKCLPFSQKDPAPLFPGAGSWH